MARRKPSENQYTTHNHVQLVRGGAPYFKAIEDIAADAKYSLHFQTYIFDADETGTAVAKAFIAAAKRGVHVYLMIDGYASQKLPKEFIGEMKAAGVHFRFFEPLLLTYRYYFGRRMHHKVLVADGYVGLVGGINVSNRYNDMPDKAAWLDWSIMVRGETAMELHNVCVKTWERSVFGRKRCEPRMLPQPTAETENCRVRVRRNDWVYGKTDIYKTYRSLFATAREYATVMTSYFWPPRSLLSRMEVAARRGVKIRIVLTAHADVPLAKYAERYLYRRLFRSGIEVYEYQPNVLHAKLAFMDDKWVTVGSYNVNNISAFASIELNLDVENARIATEMREAVEQIIANDCRQVVKEDYYLTNNPLRMFLYYLSYRAVHLIFFLFTFYFSQKKAGK